jgi:glutamine synthetase
LQSYLEKDLVEVYVGLKRNEWKRWESAVTDWEQGEYARVY